MAVTIKQMSLLVAVFGVLSFDFEVIAENKKPATGTPITGKDVVICKYPSDPTVALGFVSFGFLGAASVAGGLPLFYPYKGKSVPRPALFKSTSLLVFFIVALGTTGLIALMLLWPTITEQNQGTEKHLHQEDQSLLLGTRLLGCGHSTTIAAFKLDINSPVKRPEVLPRATRGRKQGGTLRDEKVEFLCDLKHASKRRRRSEHNVESCDVGSGNENIETDELDEKTDEIRGFLVPGSSGDSWSDVKKGLVSCLGCTFSRKNFVQVKKFVETKKMGNVLLFFHGKFYQTAEYWRWSGCRKGKFRKYALGQRLFSGLRHIRYRDLAGSIYASRDNRRQLESLLSGT